MDASENVVPLLARQLEILTVAIEMFDHGYKSVFLAIFVSESRLNVRPLCLRERKNIFLSRSAMAEAVPNIVGE